MAIHEGSDRSAVTGLVATVRALSVLLFTTAELAALAVWSTLTLQVPLTSGPGVFAAGVLIVGLGIEYVLRDLTINGADLAAPSWSVVVFSATEGLIWELWFVIAVSATQPGGLVLAATVFVVLLLPQHTVEDNALRGVSPFSEVLDIGTAGFTVVKAMGATVWLALVVRPAYLGEWVALTEALGTTPMGLGFAVLAITLLVEHTVSVGYSRSR